MPNEKSPYHVIAFQLKIARRVALHQLFDPRGNLLASEKDILKMLARLSDLTADGYTVITDDGKYIVTVKALRAFHVSKGQTLDGQNRRPPA